MNSSYALIDSADVIEVAEECLRGIQDGRDRLRESLIQKEIKRRHWWRRIFWFLPEHTPESAREALECGDSFSEWNMVNISYGRQEDCCHRLIRLADAAGDGLVNVTGEDLEYIGWHKRN